MACSPVALLAIAVALASSACEIVADAGAYAVGGPDAGSVADNPEEDASAAAAASGGEPAECSGPECPVVLATTGDSSDAFVAIAVDGTRVYWTDGATIWSCAVEGCGGAPAILVDPSTFEPGDILALAVDGTHVFWASGASASPIFQCPAAGCSATGPAVLTVGGPPSGGLAVDATNVYWTDGDGIESCAVAGCWAPTLLAAGTPWDLLTTDEANVYWAELDGTVNTILSCAKMGCAMSPTVVMQTAGSSYPLAAAAAGLYWLTNGPPGVSMCPRAELGRGCGGEPTLLDPGQAGDFANDIASDGTSVYWTAVSATEVVDVWGGTVVKCSPGGACSTLATVSNGAPTFITTDATSVYWTMVGSGPPRVMKRTPK